MTDTDESSPQPYEVGAIIPPREELKPERLSYLPRITWQGCCGARTESQVTQFCNYHAVRQRPHPRPWHSGSFNAIELGGLPKWHSGKRILLPMQEMQRDAGSTSGLGRSLRDGSPLQSS